MFSALDLAPVFGAGFLHSLFENLLYVVFFLGSVLLIVVILLQEGKGGGFTAAFGGVGTEAFGVKAGGINKLTAVLAAIFCVAALVLGVMTRSGSSVVQPTQPAAPGPDTGAPPPPGRTPPASPEGAGKPAPAGEPAKAHAPEGEPAKAHAPEGEPAKAHAPEGEPAKAQAPKGAGHKEPPK